MAGRMFGLLTILATLAGLASAQGPTSTAAPSSFPANMTITRTNGTGVSMASSVGITITRTATIMAYTGSAVTQWLHNDSSSSVTTELKTLPVPLTTSIPKPLPNAGRRPSQPGLRKLTIVVGLATYGLILL
ncbi:hypothetical protein E4U53_006502 [Claviceps sorghi]|nr:hypothetical protein E4U53_006502 [Claviceps sorghi]